MTHPPTSSVQFIIGLFLIYPSWGVASHVNMANDHTFCFWSSSIFLQKNDREEENSVPGAVVPTCSQTANLQINEQKGEYNQTQQSSYKLKFIKLHVSAHL